MAFEFDISNTTATGYTTPKDDTLNSFAQLINISSKAAAMDARQQGLDIRSAQVDIAAQRVSNAAEALNYKNEMAPANNARNAVWSELGASKNPDGKWATQVGADGVDTGFVMFDKERKKYNDDAAARLLSGDQNMTWDTLPAALKDKRKEQLMSYTGYNEKTGQNADLKRQVDNLYSDYASIEKLQKKQSERGFGAVTDTLLSAISSGIGLASDVTALAGVGVGMAGTWLGADSVGSMAKILYGAAEAAKGVSQAVDTGKTAQGQKQARESAAMMKKATEALEAEDYVGMAKFATNAFMNDGTGSIGMLLGSFVGSGILAKALAKVGAVTAERAGLTAGLEKFSAELGKLEARGAVAGATAIEKATATAATAILNTGNAMPGIMSAGLAGAGTSVLENREALTKGFMEKGLTGKELEEAVTRGTFEAATQGGLMPAAVTMLMPGKFAETFFTGGVRQKVAGELSAAGASRMKAAMSRGGAVLKEAVLEASEEAMDEGFSSGKGTTKNQQAILDGKGSQWWSFDGPAATQGFIGGGLTGGSVRLVSRDGRDTSLPETAPTAPEAIKGDTIEMPDLTGAITGTFGLSGTTAFTMSKYANMAEKGDWSFLNDFTAQQMELHKDKIAGNEDQFRAHVMESVGSGLNIPGLVDAGQLATAVSSLSKQLDGYTAAQQANTPGQPPSGTAYETANKAVESARALLDGALANDGTIKISPEDIAKIKQLSTAVLLATNEQKVQSYGKRGATKSLEFQASLNSASDEKLAQMALINKDNAPYLAAITEQQTKRTKSDDPISAAQVVIDWFNDPTTDEPTRMKFSNQTNANVQAAADVLSRASTKDGASEQTAKARREYIRQLTIQSAISVGSEVSYSAVDTSVLTGMLSTYNKALASAQKTPTGIVASDRMIAISESINRELESRVEAGELDPIEAAEAKASSAAAAKAAKIGVEGNTVVDSAIEQAGVLVDLENEQSSAADLPRKFAVTTISSALAGPHGSRVYASMTKQQKEVFSKLQGQTQEGGAVKGASPKPTPGTPKISLKDYSPADQALLVKRAEFNPTETEKAAIDRLIAFKQKAATAEIPIAITDQTLAEAHAQSYADFILNTPARIGIERGFFTTKTLEALITGGVDVGARVNAEGKPIDEVQYLADNPSLPQDEYKTPAPAETPAPAKAPVPPVAPPVPVAPPGVTVIQNRDRSTDESIAQMQSIAAAPNYNLLGPSTDLVGGAPVVAIDPQVTTIAPEQLGKGVEVSSQQNSYKMQYAVVEADQVTASNQVDGTPIPTYETAPIQAIAGNGRIAGLTQAYVIGTANNYREAMAKDTIHGVSADVINGMKNPVLVRVMNKGDITENMGNESNQSGVAALSPIQQARNDARLIDLSKIDFNDDGTPSRTALVAFVNQLTKNNVGLRPSLLQNGEPTEVARQRLMSAVLMEAYGSDDLVRRVSAADQSKKNILSSLVGSAAEMIKLEGSGVFDVRPQVLEAAERALSTTLPLDIEARQIDTLRSPESDVIFQKFVQPSEGNKLPSAKSMTTVLRNLAQGMREAFEGNINSMFPDLEPVTKEQVYEKYGFDTKGLAIGGNLQQPAGAVAPTGNAGQVAAVPTGSENTGGTQGDQPVASKPMTWADVRQGFDDSLGSTPRAFRVRGGPVTRPKLLIGKRRREMSKLVEDAVKMGVPASLVARVKTVGITSSSRYNAMWIPGLNSLVWGNSLLSKNESQLMATLTHELGHTLDSVQSSDTIGRISMTSAWDKAQTELKAWYNRDRSTILEYPFGESRDNETNRAEAFAQAFRMFFLDSASLKRNAPSAYEVIFLEVINENENNAITSGSSSGAGGQNTVSGSGANPPTAKSAADANGVGRSEAGRGQQDSVRGEANLVTVAREEIAEEQVSRAKQRANPPNKDMMDRQARINKATASGPISLQKLGQTADTAREGFLLAMKKAGGGFLTLDAMVNVSGHLFKTKDGNNLLQAVNRERKRERSALDANIERLSGTILKTITDLANKNQFKAVGDLINLSQYEDFAPDGKAAPVSQTQKDMSAQWKALNGDQKLAYKQIRSEYTTQFERISKAIIDVAKDLSSDAAAALTKALKNRGVENYFALRRQGDYYNLVKDKSGKVVWYSKSNSLGEIKNQYDELLKEFPADKYDVSKYALVSDTLSKERTAASSAIIGKMESELAAKGYPQPQIDSIIGLFEDSILAEEAKKNANALTQRQYVLGASVHASQSTLGAMQDMERLIAYTVHGKAVAAALLAAKKHVDASSINNREYNKAEAQLTLEQFQANINQRTSDSKVSGFLAGAGFVTTMFGNVSSAVLQLSGLQVVGVPTLGARFGFVKAQTEITKSIVTAGSMIAKFAMTTAKYAQSEADYVSGKMSKADQAEFRPLYYAKQNGLIDLNATNNFMDAAQSVVLGDPLTLTGKLKVMTYDRLKTALSWPLQKAELLTSLAGFSAAFNLEAQRVGLDKMKPGTPAHTAALEAVSQFAGDAKNIINFDGSAANKSRWSKTSVGRPVLLLRSYGINMAALMYGDAKTILREWKGNPAEAQLAAKRLGGIVGMHALLAGKAGLPFIVYQPLMAVAIALGGGTGDEEKDKEAANLPMVDRFRNMMTENFGEAMTSFVMGGLVGEGAAGRISIDKLLIQGDDRSPYGLPSKPGDLALNALGPGISNLVNLFYKSTDDPMNVGKYAPGALANIVKGWNLADNGNVFVSKKGNEVRLTPTDTFMQLIGFRPGDVARLASAEQAQAGFTLAKGKAETRTLTEINDAVKKEAGGNITNFSIDQYIKTFNQMSAEQFALHEENWKPIEPERIRSFLTSQYKKSDQTTDPRSDKKKEKDSVVSWIDSVISRGDK